MKELTKIGIYGGTFSPPHRGHIASAQEMLRALPLDELYVIPTATPPHKELSYAIEPSDRLALSKIAFGAIERCTVSDMEIRRGGKSYTVDTLKALSGKGRELYLLVGTDMLLPLDTWYHAKDIFALATIVYVRRETDPDTEREIRERVEDYQSRFGARIIEIQNEVIEISSGELREMILSNSPKVSEYLTDEVYAYIQARGLYRNDR